MSTSREIRSALIQSCADVIMREIHDDMQSDYRNSKGERMPADVGSFSELHDYCDANTYLLDFVPENKPACDCVLRIEIGDHADDCATRIAWNAYMELCNDVSDVVDKMLAAEALALDTGERCKSDGCNRLVRFAGGDAGSHYAHIDDGSHGCEPCEFCQPVLGRLPKGSILA